MRLVFTCVFCAVLGYFAARTLAFGPLVALPLAVFAGAIPAMYVALRRRRRLQRIERQLPDALDLLTRAVRSGHAFSSALKMIGEEMVDPIAGEFAFVHDEINYGVTLEQSLHNLGERVPLMDLRYFVIAVVIQRDSGGNLAEVMTNLSRLIRARLKLMDKVRVLSSEGRMSGWILVLMPFGLGSLLMLVNPEFMKPFFSDPIGVTILKYLSVMMLMGILLIRKIVRIRV
jgi:tight adherence protein B